MSKLFKTFMAVAAFASLTVVSSCTKTCDEGFEGDKCDTEIREKVVGTYSVTEDCTVTGGATYSVSITKSGTDVTKVLINPMGGYPSSTGTVSVDGTSITIAEQTTGGYTFSGSGTINNGGASITVTYTVGTGGVSETCNGTWTKQ